MVIDKIKVKNYKIFQEKTIHLNDNVNIFVGENDAGKSTILEIVNLITTGKINGYFIDRQITANFFTYEVRKNYIENIKSGKYAELPEIMIEAYCKNKGDSEFRGTNNTLGEDCPGIAFYYTFNQDNADIYKRKLKICYVNTKNSCYRYFFVLKLVSNRQKNENKKNNCLNWLVSMI